MSTLFLKNTHKSYNFTLFCPENALKLLIPRFLPVYAP